MGAVSLIGIDLREHGFRLRAQDVSGRMICLN